MQCTGEQKRTRNSNCPARKEYAEELFLFHYEKHQLEKLQMEFTAYQSKKAGTKKKNSRKQIGLTSEILSTSCRRRKKFLKQNTIMASFVLLKNTNRERKEMRDYCLTAPRGKQLAPQIQHKKFPAFRKLQVSLYDILDKNCVPTLKKSYQISNVEAMLGKVKKGTTEVDNSTEAGGFSEELDPEQTNSDCDIRKSRNGAKSSKCLVLSDQSLFATLSFIEPNHGNAVMDPCHTQTDEDRKRNFQEASVPIFDAEKMSTQCLEPSEKCIESGSHMVREIEKDGAYYKTEDDQDVEEMRPRDSSETTISDVTQPYSLHSISVSDEGVLQNKEVIPVFSKDIFSKTSINRMILSDRNPLEGGRCQVSELLSSFSEINLKLDVQTLTSNKGEIKLPVKEMMGLSLNTLTEKIHEDQMTLEKEESNTKDCNKNTESFYRKLLKNNESQYDKAPLGVAEEKMAGDLEYGDDGLSDHGAECLLSDGNLAEQTYPDDDDGVFIHTEATMPVEDKQVSFFNNEKENRDFPPAK
ncbi:hypothetical protein E2320_000294 [Naja naja]|nr:hypothetical protein E2320_000294 [Naja naja]